MPIVRGEHSFDSHFTQIPNAWLRDNRLSYKARGLLAELVSHTVGWEVSIQRIANNGVDGKDSIGSAIQELENLGYLRREQQRDQAGRLAGNLWITQDPADLPLPEKPLTDNPHPKKNIDKNTDLKEINAQFDLFWSEYPRKVGRANAFKAFVKLRHDEKLVSIAAAQRLATDPNLPPLQYVPYPATWINREGWLDEPYPEREKTPEEKQALVKIESERKSAKAAVEREQLLAGINKAKEEAEKNPPKLCKHNRVAVVCSECARINKNKGVSNGRD